MPRLASPETGQTGLQVALANARVIAPLAVLQSMVYFTLNHLPPFPSRELPLTWVDEAMPFWPWTVWPYLALLTSDVVLALLVRSRAVFRRVLIAYVLAMSMTAPIWLFFPTAYPRPPVPEDDSYSSAAYRRLVVLDSPECCFPSGHILVPALGCWALAQDRPGWGPWLYGGLVCLSLTILTTKQHYTWDLLGGLAAAMVGIVLSGWLSRPDAAKDDSSTPLKGACT